MPQPSRNKLHSHFRKLDVEASSPNDDQQKVSIGVISDVRTEDGQVKVRLFERNGEPGEEILGGVYLPVLQSFDYIHKLFGQLRKGLYVRVWWKGKLEPRNCLVEIIGDENTNFIKKDVKHNDMETGVYKFFMGGL